MVVTTGTVSQLFGTGFAHIGNLNIKHQRLACKGMIHVQCHHKFTGFNNAGVDHAAICVDFNERAWQKVSVLAGQMFNRDFLRQIVFFLTLGILRANSYLQSVAGGVPNHGLFQRRQNVAFAAQKCHRYTVATIFHLRAVVFTN